jgi:hypothetical protein
MKSALLVGAVVAAWVAVAAGSAGATVLWTTNAYCPTAHNGGGGQIYVPNDTIIATSRGLQFTTSAGDITCNKAELRFQTDGDRRRRPDRRGRDDNAVR